MDNNEKDENQVVNKLSKTDLIANCLLVVPFTFNVGFFFLLILLNSVPEIFVNIWVFVFVLFLFPIIFTIIAIARNKILESLFSSSSNDKILNIAEFINRFPLLAIVGFFTFTITAVYDQANIFKAVVTLFLIISLYVIFQRPLSFEGRVNILFEQLLSNLDDFYKRQYYLKKISKIIENTMKVGNVKILSNDIIFNFNKKLLESNENISNDLQNIKEWLLGTQGTCIGSLRNIYSDFKIEPLNTISLYKKIFDFENPTIKANLLKFMFTLITTTIIITVVLIFQPERINEIITLLQKLL